MGVGNYLFGGRLLVIDERGVLIDISEEVVQLTVDFQVHIHGNVDWLDGVVRFHAVLRLYAAAEDQTEHRKTNRETHTLNNN